MEKILYGIGLSFYQLGLFWVSLFSAKARERRRGSRDWKEALRFFKGKRVIWMHCASLGEFEQGRPVLDALSRACPNRDIVLTFYSPSGYNIRKNYGNASKVLYLPEDGVFHARDFIDLLRPEIAIFVKYDFWYFMLSELKARNIPVFLIAARFQANQAYFNFWLKPLFKKILGTFTLIFTQDHDTYSLLNSIPELNGKVKVAGDPRYDRVVEQVENPSALPDLSDFIEGDFCFIAGSTWPQDDELLIATITELKDHRISWIIAPHEYNEKTHNRYRKAFPARVARFSRVEDIFPGQNILLVDQVGYLSSLYRLADAVYVGGGQHHRIHNIQEPSAWGAPVSFGPRHKDFPEASDLLRSEGNRVIFNSKDLLAWIAFLLHSNTQMTDLKNHNRNYILSKSGATGRIISTLQAAEYI